MGETFETKFSLGDIVEFYVPKLEYGRITCETCLGTKKVTIKDKKFDCPACYGNGYCLEQTKLKERKIGKITSIEVRLQKNFKIIEYYYLLDTEDCFFTKKAEELSFAEDLKYVSFSTS